MRENPPSRIAAGVAAFVFLVATVLMILRVEPFLTWYYPFAWYPFLILVNQATARRAPAYSLFAGRGKALAALAAWSVPLWLFFEAWNFRLENWYYVGVPDQLLLRRLGVVLSFATVLPGLFLLEELFAVRGMFERAHSREFPVSWRVRRGLWIAGGGAALLILALPRFFFPLVWAVPVLLLEPALARTEAPSLLRDLAQGRPGRILRLLLAGLGCGLFWESANYLAGGKWIYTVPWFESAKLFEMPVLGFVGFMPFALCCWSLAAALVHVGLLPDWRMGAARAARSAPPLLKTRGARALGIAGAILFSWGVLSLMDRITIDSFTPRPEDLPGIPDGVAEYAHAHGHHDVQGLLDLIEEGAFYIPGESSEAVQARLKATCRLALLRGIGTSNARRLAAIGIHSIGELAAQNRDQLVRALAALDEPGWRPRPRRVGVWVDAAREAAGLAGTPPDDLAWRSANGGET
jgi:hypothetical protein